MTNSKNGIQAQEKLDKAKIQLLMVGSIFLSTIAFNLRHRIGESVMGTAHTDGYEVVYQKEFIDKLTVEELTGLIAHEVWHVAFNHQARRGDRDKLLWMAAADYVINIMLVDAGFELPKGGLCEARFRRMSTEEVYEILYKENPPIPPEVGEHVQEPGGMSEDGEGAESSEEVIQADLQDHIRSLLVKANNQSIITEQHGDVPAEIQREITKLTNPVVPWNQLMMDFLTEKAKDDYSWKRPNRRFFPQFILPSAYSESLTNVSIAIDTSGSMSENTLAEILAEIEFIHDNLKPQTMTIYDCDSRINHEYEVDEFTDVRDLVFTGGGGTNFTPVFNKCKEDPPAVLIYFTDLYAGPITEEPGFPVLWVCYSGHKPAEIGETIYVDYEKRHQR